MEKVKIEVRKMRGAKITYGGVLLMELGTNGHTYTRKPFTNRVDEAALQAAIEEVIRQHQDAVDKALAQFRAGEDVTMCPTAREAFKAFEAEYDNNLPMLPDPPEPTNLGCANCYTDVFLDWAAKFKLPSQEGRDDRARDMYGWARRAVEFVKKLRKYHFTCFSIEARENCTILVYPKGKVVMPVGGTESRAYIGYLFRSFVSERLGGECMKKGYGVFFQYGWFGRTARSLIEAGECRAA